MTVTEAVGGSIAEDAAFRTGVAICFGVVLVVALTQVAFDMVRAAIGNGAIDIPFFKSLADAGGKIAGIKTDGIDAESKSLPLTVQAVKVRDAVMYIAGGYKGVGDDAVATVDGAVVEVE